jgi:hypothetical protein
MAYFPLIQHGTAQKTMPPTILRCRTNVFTELLPSNNKGIHRKTHTLTRPTIILLLRVFAAAGTCLPSCCLAMKREETLLSLFLATIGGIHVHTHRPIGEIYEGRR